jgi:hypothetical protein
MDARSGMDARSDDEAEGNSKSYAEEGEAYHRRRSANYSHQQSFMAALSARGSC